MSVVMKRIVQFAFHRWPWVVGVSLGLTLMSVYFIFQIKVDNSIETLSIDHDVKLRLLKEAEETFGGNEFVVISFKGDDIFSMPVLSMIEAITMDMEQIDNVESVLSLTNATIVKNGHDGVGTYPLIPEIDRKTTDMPTLKQQVISYRMYEKLLYASDGNATSIITWIVPLGKNDAARWRVVNAIMEVLETHKDHRRFYVYGMPVYMKIIYDYLMQDQIVMPIVLTFFMGCLLYFIFRDILLVGIPFFLIGITGLWAMGLFVLAGNTLDVVTFIMPSVLLIVCLCDAVHIISQYRETDNRETPRIDLLKNIIGRIGVPIMLTSLTTAIGFFSLSASDIHSIRNFGIYTGIGVLLALGISVIVLPLIMAVLPAHKVSKDENKHLVAMETLLEKTAHRIMAHRGLVIGVTGLILAISIVGALKLETNMVTLGVLKAHQALTSAQRFIDVEMAGSCEGDVLFQSDRPGAVVAPDTLKMMERIEDRFSQLFGVLKIVSITDYLKELNQAINDKDPAYYRLPDDRETIDDLLMIYSMDEEDAQLETLVNFDQSEARIRLFTFSAPDTVTTRAWIDQAETIIREASSGSDVKVSLTGRPLVWVNMMESLIMEMLKTFSLAFVIIFGVMFFLFRSWRLGVMSAVINIIPLIVAFGVMGWSRISLNSATAMLPSIAIGIAVDDTIHFIWRFERELRCHGTYEKAIVHTLKTVGKPIVITTLLICLGFIALYFSRLTIMTEFGVFLALTVFAALASDLFVAPVLMLIFRPIEVITDGEAGDLIVSETEIVMD